VRIGTSIAIATSFVPTVLTRLSQRYPRIAVHISAGEASMSQHALDERTVDLAILRLHAPSSRQHVHTEILYHDSYTVVAGVHSVWARRRGLDLAKLVREPWVLPPPESLVGSVFVDAFRARGLDYPRAAVSTFTLPVRIAMVATGQFLSIVPSSVLRFSANKTLLKAMPIDLPSTCRPIAILTVKDRTLSPATQLFIDRVREVARSLR
jgi:DNA-binding transcriptional LysR family regulator